MESSNSKTTTTSKNGTLTMNLDQQDQAAATRMNDPQEMILFQNRTNEGEFSDAEDFTMNLHLDSIELSSEEEMPPQHSKAKTKSNAIRNLAAAISPHSQHPPPEHKTAKKHLEALRALGYNNYSDTGLPYWEPRYPLESNADHNARRQKESLAMKNFINTRKQAAHQNIKNQSTHVNTPINTTLINTKTRTPSTNDNQLFTVGQKRTGEKDEHTNSKQHKTTWSEIVRNLQNELEKEREERKNLTAAVKTLQAQVSTLTHSLKELITTIQEDRAANLTPQQGTSSQHTLSEAQIKKTVQQILDPVIKDLTKPPPQPKKKTNQSPQTPAPSYSQIVGNGPAATHTRAMLASQAQHSPEETPPIVNAQEQPPPNPENNGFQKPRYQRRREQRKARAAANPTDNNTPTQRKPPRLPTSKRMNPATVLLLPSQETPNVLQKLQNTKEADPRVLGIKRHVPFASGALLVTCGSQEHATKLREIASNIGIQEKPQIERKPNFRIHLIPEYTTVGDIMQDIKKRFGDIEAKVELFPYTATKFQGNRFAVVQTSLEDLKKVRQAKSMRVGWSVCQIATNIHITRCSQCHLLGHSQHKCTQMDTLANHTDEGTTSTANADNSPSTCADCTHYNYVQDALALKKQKRPTTHKTGSKICPTLRAFQKKALPTRPLQVEAPLNRHNG